MSRCVVLALAAVISLLPTTAESAPILWDLPSGGNGHLYEAIVLPGVITWDEADSLAQARPGNWHLVTITSASEAAFVESLLDSSQFTDCVPGTLAGTICNGVWTGGFSSAIGANDWQWVTGESFAFTDWGPFEPFGNGDRIRLDWFASVGVFAWNDARNVLNAARGFILESSAAPQPVPEPLITLLFGSGLAATAIRRFRSRR